MDVVLIFLILSVNLVFSQAPLEVILFPKYPQLYVSDDVTLRCQRGKTILTSNVEWFFNGKYQTSSNGVLHFDMVVKENSGRYSCKENDETSEERVIEVLDMLPMARLAVRDNRRVILKPGGVLMDLYVEEGLQDWRCRYTNNGKEYWLPLNDDWKDNNRSVTIPAEVNDRDDSVIYWCVNREKSKRSNAITLIATEKPVMLQALDPGLVGEKMSLLCEVWGAEAENVVFYKDNNPVANGKNPYTIETVSVSDTGSYSCSATYINKYLDRNASLHQNEKSDEQKLTIIAAPPTAKLQKEFNHMECSCQECSLKSEVSYQWFETDDNISRKQILEETSFELYPEKEGYYICRANLNNFGVSRFSQHISAGGKVKAKEDGEYEASTTQRASYS